MVYPEQSRRTKREPSPNIYYSIVNNEDIVLFFGAFRFYVSWLFDRNFERKSFLMSIRSHTMVSYKKLCHLWDVCHEIEQKKIKGNFVECGVWRGGCAAIMANISNNLNAKRQIHLFDSFKGMPQPSPADGERAAYFSNHNNSGKLDAINKTVGTLPEVKNLLFSKQKLDKQNIFFHKGWFQNTIPKAVKSVGKIALLRIDADWYESVMVCLEGFYDQVAAGGYIIFDDYGYWPGCKKAVDEFFGRRKIKIKLQKIDFSGAYIIK